MKQRPVLAGLRRLLRLWAVVPLGAVLGCGCGGQPVYYLPVPADAPSGLQVMGDTVLDPLTGLQWERTLTTMTFTAAAAGNPQPEVEQARAYCTALRLGGFADWRLPARLELLSIADHTRVKPAIDPAVFPDTPPKPFWTATRQPFPNQEYAIDFGDGNITYDGDVGSPVYARCVRSTRQVMPPATTFSGDPDTVTDARTGLRWQRSAPATLYPKAEGAAAYCQGLTLSGVTNFRLPTVKELNTLIDESSVGPAIDKASFPGTASEWYWTASPYVGLTGYSWAVSFGDGASYINVSGKGIARCVK